VPKATPPPFPQAIPPPIPPSQKPVAKPVTAKIAKPAQPPLVADGGAATSARRPAVMAKAKKLTQWEVVFRVIVFVVILASVAFAWWAYSQQLIPLQKQSRELTSANSALSTEVDKIDRKWSKEEIELMRARYKEVYGALFEDPAALQEWFNHLEKKAVPLSLDVKVDFGKNIAQLTSDDKLAIIPTSVMLQVHPMPYGKESSYQRLLRFTQQLASEGKRADLAELNVTGGSSSITNAVLTFNLWAGEEKGQASQ
jgi:hypothetical protein